MRGGRSTCTFVSINRFERKKDIGLAIRALAHLRDTLSDDDYRVRPADCPVSPPPSCADSHCVGGTHQRVVLVVAGGYDRRLRENVEYYDELRALSQELGVEDKVKYMRSFTDDEKARLLESARAVLYTPANEHFGIVPIEVRCPCAQAYSARTATHPLLDLSSAWLLPSPSLPSPAEARSSPLSTT